MSEILQDVLISICTIVIPALAGFIGAYLTKKAQEIARNTNSKNIAEAIETAVEIVTDAVHTTTQTYVDSLKKQGAFTKEAQLIAFNQSRSAAIAQISESTKKLIVTKYGDFDLWLKNKIESFVNNGKNGIITLSAVSS